MAEIWQAWSPEERRTIFFGSIAVVGGFLIWRLSRARDAQIGGSQFKLREADRPKKTFAAGPDVLAEAQYAPRKKPLLLTGIRLDVPAHELLGVSAQASETQVQAAFREQIKRYHPDKIAPPGTPQWQEASRVAQALQEARDQMIARLKQR